MGEQFDGYLAPSFKLTIVSGRCSVVKGTTLPFNRHFTNHQMLSLTYSFHIQMNTYNIEQWEKIVSRFFLIFLRLIF